MTRTLVFGLGSAHGDDQLGWLVAERLAAEVSHPGVAVRRGTSPSELLDVLDGLDRLIVCDACEPLGSIGAIHQWHWPDIPFARLRNSGSHDLDLASVLALGEELRLLPADVTILGVEAEVDLLGLAPGDALNAVARRAADFIAAVVRSRAMTRSPGSTRAFPSLHDHHDGRVAPHADINDCARRKHER